MHQHQHDAQPPSGRRKFLRQLGTTAVATAALSGLADVVGLKPAAAATRAEGDMKVRGARKHASRERRAVTSVELTCYLCSGCCGSPCTPTGVYCHHCTGVTWLTGDIGVIAFAGYYCLGGNNNFTLT
jgi:anaerobic selenocysteine-containing dehydrogenase